MKLLKLFTSIFCLIFVFSNDSKLFSASRKDVAIAGAPIVQNENVDTVKMELKRYSVWLEQVTIVPLAENRKDESWVKSGGEFIESMIPFLTEQLLQNSNLDTISKERLDKGKHLQTEGCDDPLVSFLIIFGEYRLYEKEQGAFNAMCMAVNAMDNENYYPKTLVSILSTLCIQIAKTEAEHNKINPLLLSALAQATSEPYYHQNGGEIFFIRDISRSILGDYAKNILEPLKKIITSAEGFPQWVYNSSLGLVFINDAWKARGASFAYAVSDNQWDAFYERLDIAEKYLMLAWEENPNNSFVPANMIPIVMAKGGRDSKEQLRKWFDHAVSIQIDNYLPYRRYSYALLPRWGGSHEELIALNNSIRNVATKNPDTLLWARCVDLIHELGGEYHLDALSFYRLPQISKNMMLMRQIEFKQRVRSNNSVSRLAYNAYMTGFYDIAYKYFSELNWNADMPEVKDLLAYRNFESVTVFGETMVHHLAKEEMDQASKSLSEKNVAEALLSYDKAKEKANNPYADEYISICKSLAEDQVKFDNYEWVSIVPIKSRYSWRWIKNNAGDDVWWAIEEDGSLKVYSSPDILRGLLIYRLPLPPSYEITIKIKFFDDEPETQGTFILKNPAEKEKTQPRKGDAFCVLLGYLYNRNNAWVNAAVISENRNQGIETNAYLLQEYRSIQGAIVPYPKDAEISEATIKVRNGRIWFYMNGHALFENYSRSNNYLDYPSTNIGFGIPRNLEEKGFIVTEMKIRQLK